MINLAAARKKNMHKRPIGKVKDGKLYYKIPFDPLEKQMDFLSSDKSIVLYSGAFGAGKSYTLCYAAIREVIDNPNNRFLLCRKRLTELRTSTMKTFFELLPESSPVIASYHKSEQLITFKNGSELYFGGLDRPEKWASAELGGFAMDEATDFKEADFNMLISRLRKKNVKHHKGFLACNPGSKTHWIYKKFFEQQHINGYDVVETTSHDNIFLPHGTLERYDLWEKTDLDYYLRYVQGQWGIVEGTIYKGFNPSYNVKDIKINNSMRFYRAIDWGFKNPFVCLFIALDNDDNIIVFDEIYTTQKLLGTLAAEINSKYKDLTFTQSFADPSDSTNIHEFRNMDIPITPADNSVMPGIREVMARLPQIFINPKCKNTIREFQAYRWKEKTGDKNDPEIPEKTDDHTMDALRYFIYTHFKNVGLIGLRI